MNGINGIRNGYNHFKTISTQRSDLSFNIKTEGNKLPSITNLSNVIIDPSFSSYLTTESIQAINSAVSFQDYQSNGHVHYSLPNIRGFSQLNNQYYANNNNFNQSSCNQSEIQYQYQGFNYTPVVSDRTWIDAYSNDCLKPSVQPFQMLPNAYTTNSMSNLNVVRDLKIKPKENIKDEKYSLRRQKNNIAAKKCRDNKKLKSQELCDLVMKYERENESLRLEINSVKTAIGEFKKQLFS